MPTRKAGDVLVLGKPLGVGVLSAALKKEQLDAAGYAAMIANTTKLNTPGIALADDAGRARADRRHRLRPARPRCSNWRAAPGCGATIDWRKVPLLPGVRALAARRLRHRRLGPQLGRLRRGRDARAGLPPARATC